MKRALPYSTIFIVGTIALVVMGISKFVPYAGYIPAISRQRWDEIKQKWEEIWYDEDQKEFVKCWRQEYINWNRSLPTIDDMSKAIEKGKPLSVPKSPTDTCKERGYKPFGKYLLRLD